MKYWLIIVLLLFLSSCGDDQKTKPSQKIPEEKNTEKKDQVQIWINDLANEDMDIRMNAAKELSVIESKAGAAVPALIKILENCQYESERAGVIHALGKIGEKSIPALIASTEHKDPYVRGAAVYALGYMQQNAQQVVPIIIKALDDEVLVRFFAVRALGKGIGAQTKEVVPALIQTLGDKNIKVRKETADALVGIGVAAIPALIQVFAHKDPNVKTELMYIFRKIGTKAIPILAQMQNNKNPQIRTHAIYALNYINPKNSEWFAVMIKGLEDEDLGVRVAIMYILQEFDQDGSAAVPILRKIADKDSNAWMRKLARDTITKIERKN